MRQYDELAKLTPWDETVRENVAIKQSKKLAYRNQGNWVSESFWYTLKLNELNAYEQSVCKLLGIMLK